MTFRFKPAYTNVVEQKMREVFVSMTEKNRRRYAGIEAFKFNCHGSVAYLSRVFGCSEELVTRGMRELDELANDPAGSRIRAPGGGRKKIEELHPEITDQVEVSLQNRTAGDPMRSDAKYTDRTASEISREVSRDMFVSADIVRRIFKNLGYGRRKIAKAITRDSVEGRNEQFEYIAQLMDRFLHQGNPVFSIDTKKKEPLGKLHRHGSVYCQQAIEAWDHDFANWAEGQVIPHGIYDVQRNLGWLNLGLSRDTSEFATDSWSHFWEHYGSQLYPDAKEILIVCDGGGSNGCRTHIFKEDMQRVVDHFGVPIRVAHYPAYCSKYNPIERRLFSHVSRACQGMLFDNLQTVVKLMSKTATAAGLSVKVNVIDKIYDVGRKATEAFKTNMPILFDDERKHWNYRIAPQT